MCKSLSPTMQAQPVAECGAAPVLPHDRGADGLSARSVPGNDGLALVGKSDGVGSVSTGLFESRASGDEHTVPQQLRIYFNATIGRGRRGARAFCFTRDHTIDDHDCLGRRCALIDGKHAHDQGTGTQTRLS